MRRNRNGGITERGRKGKREPYRRSKQCPESLHVSASFNAKKWPRSFHIDFIGWDCKFGKNIPFFFFFPFRRKFLFFSILLSFYIHSYPLKKREWNFSYACKKNGLTLAKTVERRALAVGWGMLENENDLWIFLSLLFS